MTHAVLLPIVLPLVTGALLLLMPARWRDYGRVLGALAALALLPVAALLLDAAAGGTIAVYAVGNWPAPFGIVLQLDRLAALMLVLTALLGATALLCAGREESRSGRYFDALMQFQLMGLNGAFLAGDLFNLFVFFEILLIASYALLVHGGGSERISAGLHYVLLNLAGSSFFLVAIGMLYGVTGTLNMAHLGERLLQLPVHDVPLARAAGAMLMLVFALKAAVFPLLFWLPRAYAAAAGPVAGLFAIMTKVGIYAILRSHALLFDADRGPLSDFMDDVLWWLALVTMAFGACGALAARSIKRLTGYLVVVSVGLLGMGVSLQTPAAWSAVLYYLLSTTVSTAALFLLADALDGGDGDVPTGGQARLAGALYLVGTLAAVGLPPLSGFIGKLMMLEAVSTSTRWHGAAVLWPAVLLSSLALIVAVSRTGSRLLWQAPAKAVARARHTSVRVRPARVRRASPDTRRLVGCAVLLLCSALLVVAGRPVIHYLDATALQLHDRAAYVRATLPSATEAPR